MGVGKTIQALALATIYKEYWPCLILCPSSLKYNWQSEIKEWLSDLVNPSQIQVIAKKKDLISLNSKFIIISYELAKKIEMVKKFDSMPIRMAIADESHYLKSFDSQRSKFLVPML